MPKIILQAGHGGRTSGSTGAPNEQSFNVDITAKVADELRNRGFEVKTVGADPSPVEISGDWNLFLAIHYDADVYGTGGFFIDYPEPSTDGATAQSQAITKTLTEEYSNTTKIVNHPERTNANTRYYYMWSKLSAKTPCVLIECGVGMHTPDDHSILHFNRPLVVEGITRGVCRAFDVPYTAPTPVDTTDYKSLYEKVINESQTKLLEMAQTYEKEKAVLNTQITTLETALQTLQDTEHTWEDVADKYQRKLRAIVEEFAKVGVNLSTESDVEILVDYVSSYLAACKADRTFVSVIMTKYPLLTPEAVLEALQDAATDKQKVIDLTNEIILLKKKETAYRTITIGTTVIKFYKKAK